MKRWETNKRNMARLSRHQMVVKQWEAKGDKIDHVTSVSEGIAQIKWER
jgi:hypothetical protein